MDKPYDAWWLFFVHFSECLNGTHYCNVTLRLSSGASLYPALCIVHGWVFCYILNSYRISLGSRPVCVLKKMRDNVFRQFKAGDHVAVCCYRNWARIFWPAVTYSDVQMRAVQNPMKATTAMISAFVHFILRKREWCNIWFWQNVITHQQYFCHSFSRRTAHGY